LVDFEALKRTRLYLTDYSIATSGFRFQEASGSHKAMDAIRTSARRNVAAIGDLVSWPSSPTDDWRKGFLAGVFDAEGSYSRGILRMSNTDPQILGYAAYALAAFGFDVATEPTYERSGLTVLRVRGGLREHLRFFHTVDPSITRKRTIDGAALKHKAHLRVVAVEPLDAELPMYDITTGTGDFIANGVVSHNCFARPTHTYLDLDSGRDFERKIVVKVNAVERVRAELAPSRWAGHPIAMGTNTDPYQRCEGKYRLTGGIVEALGEARNPFSILTKSTLILRDLDVLTDAARRTDVHASLSIGTLDEQVWRTTEPGTPHPRKRVEAVAKLNQAGIPCGVLVAPVLPHLSDAPEQVEAVVKACIDAGAVSIAAVLLHLRPGEHWFDWLARKRPDLVAAHQRLYPRAYAPRSRQQELSRLVGRVVRRHRGPARPSSAPRAATGTTRRAAVPPKQLPLGL
jgi:DNA repair photolyase